VANDVALLIIDVQVEFIEGDPAVHDAANMLKRIQSLIAKARTANVPILYVEHVEDPEEFGPIHPQIAPQEGDIVIQKLTPNSFYQTPLQQELERKNIKKLILAGFQTEYCIDTTCRHAWSLGYDVVLLMDAHSTFTSDYSPLHAEQIIAHHTNVLSAFATVMSATDIQF
jgi:nicotinamidase-related amidase